MSVKVTWLGHSAFLVDIPEYQLLIDPFLTDNPVASCAAEKLRPDVILLTHGHDDHVGDTVSIARCSGALVIANYEISLWLKRQGVERTHGMQIGGRHRFEFGSLLMTPALHGSQLPDGSYGGNPAGLVLSVPQATIYHAGDTGLFSDMSLIGEEGLDLALLPIGDNFTMGPAASLRALHWLKPKYALPCHYNTWPVIAQDPMLWADQVRIQTPVEPVVLTPGQCFVLPETSDSRTESV